MGTYDAIELIYKETAYPLAELGRYLRPAPDDAVPRINQQTAEIFIFFLRHKFNNLREVAQEIDDDYVS